MSSTKKIILSEEMMKQLRRQQLIAKTHINTYGNYILNLEELTQSISNILHIEYKDDVLYDEQKDVCMFDYDNNEFLTYM